VPAVLRESAQMKGDVTCSATSIIRVITIPACRRPKEFAVHGEDDKALEDLGI